MSEDEETTSTASAAAASSSEEDDSNKRNSDEHGHAAEHQPAKRNCTRSFSKKWPDPLPFEEEIEKRMRFMGFGSCASHVAGVVVTLLFASKQNLAFLKIKLVLE